MAARTLVVRRAVPPSLSPSPPRTCASREKTIATKNDSKHRGQGAGPAVDLPTELRCLFAELLGTFGLTFFGAGAVMVDALSGHQLDYTARVVAPGLLVMVAVYTLGQISGAHINPAVTLAFALRDDFAWSRVPGYWVVQFVGAILAAAVLALLLGPVADLGSTLPRLGVPAGVAM